MFLIKHCAALTHINPTHRKPTWAKVWTRNCNILFKYGRDPLRTCTPCQGPHQLSISHRARSNDGRVFSAHNVSGFNVWGMGGFAAVPLPRVDSPWCSEASPSKPPQLKGGARKPKTFVQETALRPIMSAVPSPWRHTRSPLLPHVARHVVLPRPRCASVSRHIIISPHVTRLYPGPADDVMLMSSQESAKSAYAPNFSLKTPKVTVFDHFHWKFRVRCSVVHTKLPPDFKFQHFGRRHLQIRCQSSPFNQLNHPRR